MGRLCRLVLQEEADGADTTERLFRTALATLSFSTLRFDIKLLSERTTTRNRLAFDLQEIYYAQERHEFCEDAPGINGPERVQPIDERLDDGLVTLLLQQEIFSLSEEL